MSQSLNLRAIITHYKRTLSRIINNVTSTLFTASPEINNTTIKTRKNFNKALPVLHIQCTYLCDELKHIPALC